MELPLVVNLMGYTVSCLVIIATMLVLTQFTFYLVLATISIYTYRK